MVDVIPLLYILFGCLIYILSMNHSLWLKIRRVDLILLVWMQIVSNIRMMHRQNRNVWNVCMCTQSISKITSKRIHSHRWWLNRSDVRDDDSHKLFLLYTYHLTLLLISLLMNFFFLALHKNFFLLFKNLLTDTTYIIFFEKGLGCFRFSWNKMLQMCLHFFRKCRELVFGLF